MLPPVDIGTAGYPDDVKIGIVTIKPGAQRNMSPGVDRTNFAHE